MRKIPRLKVEYQLTRSIFLRVVGEADSNVQDDLRDDSRTELPIVIRDPVSGEYQRAAAFKKKSFRGDYLFSYQPVPGTVIFAGYGTTLADPAGQTANALRRINDGFFLKISYLFRL